MNSFKKTLNWNITFKFCIGIGIILLAISCKDRGPKVIVPTEGLEAHYPLDGNAVDLGPNGLDGIVNEAVAAENRKSKNGRSLEFDGIDTNVDLGDILDDVFTSDRASFSFSFWIYLNSNTSTSIGTSGVIAPNNLIISKLGDSGCGENERQFTIRIVEDKLNGLFFSSLNSQNFRRWAGTTTLSSETWYHVVVNYNEGLSDNDGADRLTVYLNGIEESLQLDGSEGVLGELQNGNAHLGLGNRLDSNGGNCGTDLVFNGRIDDLRIYNRLLNTIEIKALGKE